MESSGARRAGVRLPAVQLASSTGRSSVIEPVSVIRSTGILNLWEEVGGRGGASRSCNFFYMKILRHFQFYLALNIIVCSTRYNGPYNG